MGSGSSKTPLCHTFAFRHHIANVAPSGADREGGSQKNWALGPKADSITYNSVIWKSYLTPLNLSFYLCKLR